MLGCSFGDARLILADVKAKETACKGQLQVRNRALSGIVYGFMRSDFIRLLVRECAV